MDASIAIEVAGQDNPPLIPAVPAEAWRWVGLGGMELGDGTNGFCDFGK